MTEYPEAVDRRHTNSVKWDVKDGELPMTIADMDFKTSPAIIEAMKDKLTLGAFGYEDIPAEYFNAVADWYEKQHHFRPQTDWMIFTTGVVPAISSAVRRLTSLGDNVLVQAPVYNIFYNSIVNSGRHVVSSDLVYDVEQHSYSIDWEDLESKLADPLTNLMILCNPHNPVGIIWTRDQLIRLATLCRKYHVKIFSDEIHGDFTFNEQGYVPMFSLPEELIQDLEVAVSPSKTFNVAALHAATVIVPNANLRAQVSRGLNSEELAEPNLMAIPGTIAAYEKGSEWLTAVLDAIQDNRKVVSDFINDQLADVITVVPGQATYLIWLDVRKLTDDSDALAKFIQEKTGLILSAGNIYGGDGHNFLRMNVACPTKTVLSGLDRLARGIAEWQQK
ncbi:MalY/PatB family protein [Limosilactobacillus coleohominis]|uniref:cysteine-S-conjugate beta-lyase n=1 Tax=Limosilactobacillus coleohominis TaxID=181675 RepID=A0ABS2GXD9_9LACO|nr:MalY/PatB family protein [Limosilactobacillus coleohominis]MBM6939944.1 pyridoxal phosphate-dependent aminotransferase [Limosilactobacillus coleohominis]MBM6954301.1 pyridoxal phosphate-dependent aminotransferase [Limosilactobacillus coleohominis]